MQTMNIMPRSQTQREVKITTVCATGPRGTRADEGQPNDGWISTLLPDGTKATLKVQPFAANLWDDASRPLAKMASDDLLAFCRQGDAGDRSRGIRLHCATGFNRDIKATGIALYPAPGGIVTFLPAEKATASLALEAFVASKKALGTKLEDAAKQAVAVGLAANEEEVLAAWDA